MTTSNMNPNAGDSAPKLIIDTDWKSQAQAEKDRLAQSSVTKSAPKGVAPKADPAKGGAAAGIGAMMAAGAGEESGVPEEIGFKDLLTLFITNALQYMGAFADPQTGRAVVAPEMAKVYIDMLGVLETKTKGNLSEEESTLLSQSLSELRLEYVELLKMVEKAVAEGKIKPQGAGGPKLTTGMGGMGGMGGPSFGPGMGGGMGGGIGGGPGMGGMGGPSFGR